MPIYRVTSRDFVPELGLPEGTAEILQNVAVILCSRAGTMPMSRDIGLSQDWKGMPVNRAKARIVSELFEAIETQEPRARLVSVDAEVDADAPGDLVLICEVDITDV